MIDPSEEISIKNHIVVSNCMAKKLYLDHQYVRKFSSPVIRHTAAKGKPAIILEQTLFYPTSGGQPHDTGTINRVPVIDVFEDENHEIVHLLAEPLKVTEVCGRINWERRLDHMQQHTGQHLLSQAFMQTCDAETISFHLGDKSSTLDLKRAGFSIDKIAAVEIFANRIIYENRRVIAHIVGKNELDQYPVRRPPAVDDNIRIVEIKDFDFSPCGGTHCSRTGEIGIVKIRRFENYKGGSRIHFICGLRALREYQRKSEILKQIGESLSTGETELYKNIIKNRDDLKFLKREHSNLKKQLLDYEAKDLFSERKKADNINVIEKIFEDRDPKELKILGQKVLDKFPSTVILFGAKTAEKSYLLFLRSEGIQCDMGQLMQKACAVINGRGGGRSQQAQGGGPFADNLDLALQCAYDLILKS